MGMIVAKAFVSDTSPVNGGAFDGFFHVLLQLTHVLLLLTAGALLARLEGRWLGRAAAAALAATAAGVALAAARLLIPAPAIQAALLVLAALFAVALIALPSRRLAGVGVALIAALAFLLAHSHAVDVESNAAKYAWGYVLGAVTVQLTLPLIGMALAWYLEQRRAGAAPGRVLGVLAAASALAGAAGLIR